ncbi:GTP pyrophosphokinase family protein [Lachnospiraceae bacterium 62-35]
MELFAYKNRLEQKIEEQEEIIRIQEEKLRDAKDFNRLMMEYRFAIMEVETKLKVLNEEFSQEYNRNPFESIKSRLKSPASIYEKLKRKGFPVTVESIRENLTDMAGLRVICSFPDDIYRLAELFIKQDDITLLQKKDYIKHPKPNGYRSLHLIAEVPIFLSNEKKYMKVEVQFRTIAMDFWASLEHKLKYKKDVDNTDEIECQLKSCADSIEALDYQMQEIRNKIDNSRK